MRSGRQKKLDTGKGGAMRDYYLKTSEIPEELYRQTLFMIKDYDRMKTEYDNAHMG